MQPIVYQDLKIEALLAFLGSWKRDRKRFNIARKERLRTSRLALRAAWEFPEKGP
jgi:hypothetical protein